MRRWRPLERHRSWPQRIMGLEVVEDGGTEESGEQRHSRAGACRVILEGAAVFRGPGGFRGCLEEKASCPEERDINWEKWNELDSLWLC